jgi:hypothetical protein
MTFLSPLFLLGALTAALPILLHLLKREPEARVRFSAVRLLRSAPIERAHKRLLRELWLLALRIVVLLLLAFAFARPFLASGQAIGSSDATVIALDTSASMSAPGQFERARQLAGTWIQKAPGQVAVLTFSDVAQVVSRPSADRALAVAAVEAARAGVGATSYRSALTTAADLLGGRPGSIVIVTDLQESGWDGADRIAIPASARVEVADVGPSPPNLAVTAVRIGGGRLVAEIRNTGRDGRDAVVTLSAGDAERLDGGKKVAETRLPVGGERTAEVTFDAPRGRWASVSVDDQSGAAADNARFVVVDDQASPTVLVVTQTGDLAREAFYVEQALVAAGGDTARGYAVVGVAARELQAWDQARVDRHAAIVLLSTVGLEHHARALIAEYARKGGGLLVAAAADVDGVVLSDALGARVGVGPPDANRTPASARVIVASDVRHPVLRAFSGRSSLALVQFKKWTTLRAEGCQTLARFTSGEAALADCELGRGRALVLASDLDNRWNDFPLHTTFVPFLHEAIHYVTGARPAADYVTGRVPPGVPPAPGIARAPVGQRESRLVAVNIDARESDPTRLTPDEFRAAIAGVDGTGGAARPSRAGAADQAEEERQHLWQYVLVLVVGMLLVESAVAARTA